MSSAEDFIAMWRKEQAESGNLIPAWRDFRPHDLSPFSDGLVVLEYMADSSVRARLSASNIDRLYDMPGAAGQLIEGFSDQTLMRPVQLKALDTPCGFQAFREFWPVEGQPPVVIRNTALPVRPAENGPGVMIFYFENLESLQPLFRTSFTFCLKSACFLDIGAGVAGPDVVFNAILRSGQEEPGGP